MMSLLVKLHTIWHIVFLIGFTLGCTQGFPEIRRNKKKKCITMSFVVLCLCSSGQSGGKSNIFHISKGAVMQSTRFI